MSCMLPAITASAKINYIDYAGVKGYQDTDESKFLSGKTKFVYYPSELESTEKKYPVIVWANGTGCIPADYIGLFRAFAKKGFVVVACSDVMSADGKEQIACANYIIEKSRDEKSILYNKIATDKLTAMGHSQGGRSTVNAVSESTLFCCAVSIAGSNYEYEAEKDYTPTLFFTGTLDTIVPSKKWVKTAYNKVNGPAVYASLIKGVHTSCILTPEKYVDYSIQWINAWANADEEAMKVFMANGKLSKDSAWKDFSFKNMSEQNYAASAFSDVNITFIIAVSVGMVVLAVVTFVIVKKKPKEQN